MAPETGKDNGEKKIQKNQKKKEKKKEEHIQGVPKKMPHSELRLLGPYRAPLKLTLGLNTPIYDTRVCVGTKETLTLPYIVPYSPYKTTVGTPVSHPKSTLIK